MTPIAKLVVSLIAGIIIAALLLEACKSDADAPAVDHGVSVDIDTDRSKPRQKPRPNSPKVKTRR